MGRQFLSFFHRSQRSLMEEMAVPACIFNIPHTTVGTVRFRHSALRCLLPFSARHAHNLYDSKGKGDEISALAFSKVCLLPNYIQTPGWKYSEANGRIRKRSPDFQMGFCHIRRQPPTPIKKQVQIISVPALFHISVFFNYEIFIVTAFVASLYPAFFAAFTVILYVPFGVPFLIVTSPFLFTVTYFALEDL